jgi:hypothetical protein
MNWNKGRAHLLVGSIVLSLAFLGAAQASFGQTIEQRLNDAMNEITILKRVIAEQDRRITQLEKAVEALRSVSAPSGEQKEAASEPAKSKTSKALWQDPAAWAKIQEGMSEAQVVAILGKPTSVENEASLRALIYETKKSMGAGSPSGKVKLLDGRVWLIEIPIFF